MAEEKRLRKIGERKLKDITGDPMVTPGQNMESINTFKDMYGIFRCKNLKLKNPKNLSKTRNSGSISSLMRPKSSNNRSTVDNNLQMVYSKRSKSRATSHYTRQS